MGYVVFTQIVASRHYESAGRELVTNNVPAVAARLWTGSVTGRKWA